MWIAVGKNKIDQQLAALFNYATIVKHRVDQLLQ